MHLQKSGTLWKIISDADSQIKKMHMKLQIHVRRSKPRFDRQAKKTEGFGASAGPEKPDTHAGFVVVTVAIVSAV